MRTTWLWLDFFNFRASTEAIAIAVAPATSIVDGSGTFERFIILHYDAAENIMV